jgi:hypothetical protein
MHIYFHFLNFKYLIKIVSILILICLISLLWKKKIVILLLRSMREGMREGMVGGGEMGGSVGLRCIVVGGRGMGGFVGVLGMLGLGLGWLIVGGSWKSTLAKIGKLFPELHQDNL